MLDLPFNIYQVCDETIPRKDYVSITALQQFGSDNSLCSLITGVKKGQIQRKTTSEGDNLRVNVIFSLRAEHDNNATACYGFFLGESPCRARELEQLVDPSYRYQGENTGAR